MQSIWDGDAQLYAHLYQDMEDRLKLFARHTYRDSFDQFTAENQPFYSKLQAFLRGCEDETDPEPLREISRGIVRAAAEKLGENGGRIGRKGGQLNVNLMTVVYIIPAIMQLKERRAEELAQTLCAEWEAAFPGNRIGASDVQNIQSGFKTKLCYVTTAVCRGLGKPDDCYELRLLRGYRDDYLARTPEGRALIHEYYDIAPTIVKRLERDANAPARYRQIWEQYVRPCVEEIEAGENEACRARYVEMVTWLRQEYVEGYYGKRAGA